MNFEEIRNESGLEFIDISSEKRRVYLKDNSVILDIENPVGLNVSKSGGHRIVDNLGRCFYIKPDWNVLRWFVKDGKPHFVK